MSDQTLLNSDAIEELNVTTRKLRGDAVKSFEQAISEFRCQLKNFQNQTVAERVRKQFEIDVELLNSRIKRRLAEEEIEAKKRLAAQLQLESMQVRNRIEQRKLKEEKDARLRLAKRLEEEKRSMGERQALGLRAEEKEWDLRLEKRRTEDEKALQSALEAWEAEEKQKYAELGRKQFIEMEEKSKKILDKKMYAARELAEARLQESLAEVREQLVVLGERLSADREAKILAFQNSLDLKNQRLIEAEKQKLEADLRQVVESRYQHDKVQLAKELAGKRLRAQKDVRRKAAEALDAAMQVAKDKLAAERADQLKRLNAEILAEIDADLEILKKQELGKITEEARVETKVAKEQACVEAQKIRERKQAALQEDMRAARAQMMQEVQQAQDIALARELEIIGSDLAEERARKLETLEVSVRRQIEAEMSDRKAAAYKRVRDEATIAKSQALRDLKVRLDDERAEREKQLEMEITRSREEAAKSIRSSVQAWRSDQLEKEAKESSIRVQQLKRDEEAEAQAYHAKIMAEEKAESEERLQRALVEEEKASRERRAVVYREEEHAAEERARAAKVREARDAEERLSIALAKEEVCAKQRLEERQRKSSLDARRRSEKLKLEERNAAEVRLRNQLEAEDLEAQSRLDQSLVEESAAAAERLALQLQQESKESADRIEKQRAREAADAHRRLEIAKRKEAADARLRLSAAVESEASEAAKRVEALMIEEAQAAQARLDAAIAREEGESRNRQRLACAEIQQEAESRIAVRLDKEKLAAKARQATALAQEGEELEAMREEMLAQEEVEAERRLQSALTQAALESEKRRQAWPQQLAAERRALRQAWHEQQEQKLAERIADLRQQEVVDYEGALEHIKSELDEEFEQNDAVYVSRLLQAESKTRSRVRQQLERLENPQDFSPSIDWKATPREVANSPRDLYTLVRSVPQAVLYKELKMRTLDESVLILQAADGRSRDALLESVDGSVRRILQARLKSATPSDVEKSHALRSFRENLEQVAQVHAVILPDEA